VAACLRVHASLIAVAADYDSVHRASRIAHPAVEEDLIRYTNDLVNIEQ
jgi:hypothetical protein